MKQVLVGKTGVCVSQLGLGTMTFGSGADETTSKAIYGAARNAGINFFDCANVYANGESERLLGDCIAHERDEIVLATKAYFPTSKDVNARGSSRRHIRLAVDASLKRLKTDRIDLFFLHRHDDVTALDETARALEDLVRSGKILYPALSNFSAWQSMKLLGIQRQTQSAPLVACQPMYNLIKRQAEVEILPWAESESIAVFPYSPLAGGLLTGKYSDPNASGRIRDNAMYRTRYNPETEMMASRFVDWCAKHSRESVPTAIAWCLSHPAVTAPLVGVKNLSQLKSALRAIDVELSEKHRAEIDSLTPTPPPATDRSEESSEHNYGNRLPS